LRLVEFAKNPQPRTTSAAADVTPNAPVEIVRRAHISQNKTRASKNKLGT
jgi:hypothetical protein